MVPKTVTVNNAGGSMRTLQQCLVCLGADRCEIYAETSYRVGFQRKTSYRYRSLRSRYSNKDELASWAVKLWKQSIQKFHPDKPNGDEETAKRLNMAIARIHKILRIPFHGGI